MNDYIIDLIESDIEYHEHALSILVTEDVTDVPDEDKESWLIRHSTAIVYGKEILKRFKEQNK